MNFNLCFVFVFFAKIFLIFVPYIGPINFDEMDAKAKRAFTFQLNSLRNACLAYALEFKNVHIDRNT